MLPNRHCHHHNRQPPSPAVHPALTPHAPRTHPALTPHSPRTHPALTPHSPPLHPALTPHSPRTHPPLHPALTPHSPRTHPQAPATWWKWRWCCRATGRCSSRTTWHSCCSTRWGAVLGCRAGVQFRGVGWGVGVPAGVGFGGGPFQLLSSFVLQERASHHPHPPVHPSRLIHPSTQVEALEDVERAFVHTDYTLRDAPEHKVWAWGAEAARGLLSAGG